MKFKTILLESSLKRVWEMGKIHQSGTISAFRYAEECGAGRIHTKNENIGRNLILKSKLITKKYSITAIDGTFIENYKSDSETKKKEVSFIVVDINDTGNLKEDLIKYGTIFEQDSITFSLPNGEYYLISTNTCPKPFPGFGKIGVEFKLGKPMFGKDGECYSRVNGRPFVFESILDTPKTLDDYSQEELNEIKILAETEMINDNRCSW